MDQTERYRPISVQDTTMNHPLEGIVPSKRVNFRMADGTTSYVVVPRSEYTAEQVRKAIEEHVTNHEQVMAIRGGYSTQPVNMESNPWGQTG